jgi:hypothetical protein
MVEVRYACTGSCHGMVTEEEFLAGKDTCAAASCDRHGQHLVRKAYCSSCQVVFPEGEKHTCKK